MRRQMLAIASLVAAVVVAGAAGPLSAADLPTSSPQATDRVIPVKKSGRSLSTRVAVAESSQIRTAWHRCTFPLVLGIAY
jgi:hypothetical protein